MNDTNKETIRIMQDAGREITALRRRNEILEAKVEVFDSMMQVLHTSPAQRGQTMSVDVVSEIEQQVGRLQAD